MGERLSRVIPAIALTGSLLFSANACSSDQSPHAETCYDAPIPAPPVPQRPEYDPPELADLPDLSNSTPAEVDAAFDNFNASMDAFNNYQAEHNQQISQYESQMDPENLTVQMGPDGFPEDSQPTVAKDVTAKATAGLVEIEHDNIKGSGFVVKNDQGKQVVVTAAHVVDTTPFKKIKIITNNGESIAPNGGCYMFERDGKQVSFGDKLADFDLAILTLPEALPVTPLPLAASNPTVGDWVSLVNYQGDYGPSDFDLLHTAASYTALIAPHRPDDTEISLISGIRDLGPNVTNGQYDATHIIPGASGGPVVNNNGEVVGVSTDGIKYNIDLSLEDISYFYDINFAGVSEEANPGFIPSHGGAQPVSLIKILMAAKAIRNPQPN